MTVIARRIMMLLGHLITGVAVAVKIASTRKMDGQDQSPALLALGMLQNSMRVPTKAAKSLVLVALAIVEVLARVILGPKTSLKINKYFIINFQCTSRHPKEARDNPKIIF